MKKLALLLATISLSACMQTQAQVRPEIQVSKLSDAGLGCREIEQEYASLNTVRSKLGDKSTSSMSAGKTLDAAKTGNMMVMGLTGGRSGSATFGTGFSDSTKYLGLAAGLFDGYQKRNQQRNQETIQKATQRQINLANLFTRNGCGNN